MTKTRKGFLNLVDREGNTVSLPEDRARRIDKDPGNGWKIQSGSKAGSKKAEAKTETSANSAK